MSNQVYEGNKKLMFLEREARKLELENFENFFKFWKIYG